jgi:hypothetical protein
MTSLNINLLSTLHLSSWLTTTVMTYLEDRKFSVWVSLQSWTFWSMHSLMECLWPMVQLIHAYKNLCNTPLVNKLVWKGEVTTLLPSTKTCYFTIIDNLNRTTTKQVGRINMVLIFLCSLHATDNTIKNLLIYKSRFIIGLQATCSDCTSMLSPRNSTFQPIVYWCNPALSTHLRILW